MRAGWIFPAELILLAACIRRVCANRRERNALGRMDFFQMDLILPSACILCACATGERETTLEDRTLVENS